MIDYYNILHIEPSATIAEIKKAYRQQALLYHPDKTPDDKESLAYFSLIKEAYETLTTPSLKEKYLQERWLLKAYNRTYANKISTPSDVLKELLTIYKTTFYIDEHRMDKKGFKENLLHILSDTNIDILNNFNEKSTNNEIIKLCLQILQKIPPKAQMPALQQLDKINTKTTGLLNKYYKQLQKQAFWEKLRFVFILLAIMLLCLLIWISY